MEKYADASIKLARLNGVFFRNKTKENSPKINIDKTERYLITLSKLIKYCSNATHRNFIMMAMFPFFLLQQM